MSFKTKKYQVIRQALSKELANFIFNYMMLQRDAVDFMVKNNKVNPYNPFMGTRTDNQIPGTYSKYASLDDKTDGFHYYLAFIKFGIGRATSDAAHQVRDNIITRDQGVDLVHQYDKEFPSKNLDVFLDYMKIDKNKFEEIVDKFRRDIIWKKENNEWKLRQQVQKN